MHSGDSNECKICGKFFKDSQDLKTHIRVHTGTRQKPRESYIFIRFLGRKAGSFVKEIGKSKAVKKEQKKDAKNPEATSPQPILNSRKRKRRSEMEHVHDDDEEEETPKTYRLIHMIYQIWHKPVKKLFHQISYFCNFQLPDLHEKRGILASRIPRSAFTPPRRTSPRPAKWLPRRAPANDLDRKSKSKQDLPEVRNQVPATTC